MESENILVRDFIYLDWERVRSLAAQLFKGVPEEAAEEKQREVTAGGRLEGGVPGILRGKTGADYRFFRSENETRSFHHHIYSITEQELSKNGMITEIDGNFVFQDWRVNYFNDGQFILATGLLRLMDYAWMSSFLEALPKMMKAAQHAESLGLKQKRDAQIITQQQFQVKIQERQKTLKEIKEMKMDELTMLIRQLYGEVVRIKVLPSKDNPDKVLVGTGLINSFYETAASLSQKYGYEVDANWKLLGQINISSNPDEPEPIPTGNEFEDSFEQLALGLNKIIRITSSPMFPAISVTPISIYRLC
ncbi:MAG: hypothetical protein A2W01_03125 [Candidatus Solincola sediminis]|nr:MAG: hypothetical protein A2W01_03125 [Candidatus Solincola sediminis]